jgi:hypothetical protein
VEGRRGRAGRKGVGMNGEYILRQFMIYGLFGMFVMLYSTL